MFASVRAMFSGIVDYAGMFPPAQLPLEQAIHNYARYRTEPESWMLGRFVCPAARLEELSPFVEELFREGPPLAISALGRPSSEIEEFSHLLADDIAAIVTFRSRHGQRVVVDVFENRLPEGLPAQSNGIPRVKQCAREAISLAERYGLASMRFFFEASLGTDWRTRAPWVGLGGTLSLSWPGPPRALLPGFKIRCGGSTALTVPSSEQLASIIVESIHLRVPLKFTAGLHHPVRHFNPETQTDWHGFLNVFAAGILASARFLNGAGVRQVIEDERAMSFAFDLSSMHWQDVRAVTVEEIREARQDAVLSFGSCSFDEPREGLRELGLIP
jgi:hypothetical protein